MLFAFMPTVVLAAGAVFGSEQAAPAESSAPPAVSSIGGRWVLNPELSDDARQKMREARDGMRGGSGGSGGGGSWNGGGMGGHGGGMGGHGGGGMGGHGGGMGHGGSGGDRGGSGEGRESSFRAAMEAANELLITPTESEVVLMEKDGRMRVVHPDGKGHKTESGEAEVKAHWDSNGARLVVETKSERGPRVTETYETAPDKTKMTLTLRLEGGTMPAVSVKRVYEPAESKTAPSPPAESKPGNPQ